MKVIGTIKSRAISVLLASLLLTACGGDKPDAMLASARDYLAKGDRNAAVIQIKNALQSDPANAEARLLLGKALIETGDPVAAELELRKALELKTAPELVLPALAKAMIMGGQFKKVVEDFAAKKLASAPLQAELLTSVGIAQAALGTLKEAEQSFSEAVKLAPDYAPALLAQARLLAVGGNIEGAIALADQVLAKTPTEPEALKLKGDMFRVKGDLDGAVDLYRKTVAARGDLATARGALITVLMQQEKLEDAEKELQEMRKSAANNPQTVFLDAQLAYRKRDFRRARESVLTLLKVAPENIAVTQLAGAVEFQSGAYVQAENYLAKVVNAAPNLPFARRLLIATYLRTGQVSKAVSTLESMLDSIEGDAEMLSLAGEVYAQNGDFERAEKMFEMAAKLDPRDPRKRTSLALAHLVKGKDELAFDELQNIASSDAGNTADLAMISAYLRKGELNKALKSIDGLIAKQPQNPLGPTLKGRALVAKRDLASARESFMRALKIKPDYFPAAASLATIDLAEKKVDDARQRFEAILTVDPKNSQALIALAELKAKTGGTPDEIATALDRAVKAHPADPRPRLLLVDLQLRAKEAKKAVALAQDALAAIPDHPGLMSALGRAQLAAGEINQAITTFGKLAQQQPHSPQPHLMLAEAHMAAKDKSAAEQALRKGLEIKPDYLEAQRGLILLGLDSGKPDTALALAKDIQKQRPKDGVGYALEGDIGVTLKNWGEAATAYRAGLKQNPSTEMAIKLHSVLLADNKTADADKFSSVWLKDHPKDIAFRFHLADQALRSKNLSLAASLYKGVLELQPNNPGALNNLAWVSGELKDPKAIEYAEKSNQLAPNQPIFMDTLAMLLAGKGDTGKALEILKKALSIQPDAAPIRLNYARVLLNAGDKVQARKELETLAGLGDKFAAQAEVSKLRQGL